MKLRHCGYTFIFGESYLTSLAVSAKCFRKLLGKDFSRKGRIPSDRYEELMNRCVTFMNYHKEDGLIYGHHYKMIHDYIKAAKEDDSYTVGVYWNMSWLEYLSNKYLWNKY